MRVGERETERKEGEKQKGGREIEREGEEGEKREGGREGGRGRREA